MVALQFLVLSVVVRVRLGQRGAASEVIRSPFLYAFGKSNLLSFMSLFYLYSIRNSSPLLIVPKSVIRTCLNFDFLEEGILINE